MNDFLQDLRFATRSFFHNPGFSATAVLSLAFGIGANTAMFTVSSALLLHRLPYQDANRLAILWNRSPGLNITQDWFSTAQYFDIRNSHHGFEQLAIAIGGNYNWTGRGEPERVGTIRASSNLLPMLGARAVIGRLFAASEDSPGAPRTAVLSYGTWERRYGRERSALGKTVTLNGDPYQIVGVLSRSFVLPREILPTLGGAEEAEILLSLPLSAAASTVRTREDYNIMGRLKPGVSVQSAQAEMDTITARLRRDYPAIDPPNGGLTFGIVPLLEQVVGEVRRPLIILSGAVGFVLLIACANVANLLLSRAVAREREIAVRMALGAGQARILRQLLTESGLLAVLGGALGVALSVFGIQGLRWLGSHSIPRLREIDVNWEVLAFTLVLSLMSGVLFGMAPAMRARRVDVQENLKGSGRGASVSSRGNHLRRLLVVAELALSIVLMIGAGLLLRSFAHLQNVAPGFNPNQVLTFGLMMSGRKYAEPQPVRHTYKQILERIEGLTAVTAAGAISALPLSQMYSWGPITVEGRIPAAGASFINADERIVAGNYFQAMQIPLRQGRFFSEHDIDTAPRVAIVDEFMAREIWPNEDPVGKRLHTGDWNAKMPWITVVGVVGRIKQYTLDADSRIALYLPQTQYPTREMNVVLRSSSDPAFMGAAVRKLIADIDPDLPIYHVRTMSDRLIESVSQQRFSMVLASLFAGLALLLAAIGTYGVMSYMVSQGFREIGIRIALGATPRAILKLVLRRGWELSASGVIVGLLGAFALTRLLRSQIFGVGITDPFTFLAAILILIAIALIASYVPARRAARVDPMKSLRNE